MGNTPKHTDKVHVENARDSGQFLSCNTRMRSKRDIKMGWLCKVHVENARDSGQFLSCNMRMRSKRDIKMGWLCTPGGGGGGGQSSEMLVGV